MLNDELIEVGDAELDVKGWVVWDVEGVVALEVVDDVLEVKVNVVVNVQNDGYVLWWMLPGIDEPNDADSFCCWWQSNAFDNDDLKGVIDAGVVEVDAIDDSIDEADALSKTVWWWLCLFDVIDDKVLVNCFDVEVADDRCTLLTYDVQDVDILDDVVVLLTPYDEMMSEGTMVGLEDANVSPLDMMRPVGSISGWTRMCDAKCFPLKWCHKNSVEVVVDDGLTDDGVFASEESEDGQVDAIGLDVLTFCFDHDALRNDDVLLWCVHWWCCLMTLRLLMVSWWYLSDDTFDEVDVGWTKGPDELVNSDVIDDNEDADGVLLMR